MQIRYSLVLGYLFLPFAAAAFKRFESHRKTSTIAVVILLSIVPLSYSRVVLARTMGSTFPNPFPADVEPIPKVSRRATNAAKIIATEVRQTGGGLIVDFFNWKDTRYVGLTSKLWPTRIWFLPGERHEKFDVLRFEDFLLNNPNGILIRLNHSRHMKLDAAEQTVTFQSRELPVLGVTLLHTVEDLKIYRYTFRE